jgi:hypothetical protein
MQANVAPTTPPEIGISELVYFNNKEFESADAFEKIISSIEINKLTLKDVYNHLIDYGRRIVETREMISFSDYLIEVP